jgi:hypothetical protein
VVVIRSKPLPADEMTMNAAANTNAMAWFATFATLSEPEAESFEKRGSGEVSPSPKDLQFKFKI